MALCGTQLRVSTRELIFFHFYHTVKLNIIVTKSDIIDKFEVSCRNVIICSAMFAARAHAVTLYRAGVRVT